MPSATKSKTNATPRTLGKMDAKLTTTNYCTTDYRDGEDFGYFGSLDECLAYATKHDATTVWKLSRLSGKWVAMTLKVAQVEALADILDVYLMPAQGVELRKILVSTPDHMMESFIRMEMDLTACQYRELLSTGIVQDFEA